MKVLELNVKDDVFNNFNTVYVKLKELGWERVRGTLIFFKEYEKQKYFEIVFPSVYKFQMSKLNEIVLNNFDIDLCQEFINHLRNFQTLVICDKKYLTNTLLDCTYTFGYHMKGDFKKESKMGKYFEELIKITENYNKTK